MKNLLKFSLLTVFFVAANVVLAQTPATTTPTTAPATQGSSKKNKKVAGPKKQATQTTPAAKPAETKSEKSTGTSATEGKKEETGTGNTNTRMAISEQGVPAEKPKTAPTVTPK